MSADCSNSRILIIDDNPAIHEDFKKILCGDVPIDSSVNDLMSQVFGKNETRATHATFELDSAFQGREGLEKLERSVAEGRPYAMAFVDIRMPPGWDGVETITHLWAVDPAVQMVICTAYSDYSWQEIVDQLGNSDRLVILKKPFDNIEVLQLAHALTQKWVVTAQAACKLEDLERMVNERTADLDAANRKLQSEVAERTQAQEALRQSEERFSKAFNASPIPIAILTAREPRCVDANESFFLGTGYGRGEILGRRPEEIGLCAKTDGLSEMFMRFNAGEDIAAQEFQLLTKSGEVRPCLVWLKPFELGGAPHMLAILQDVAGQRKLEDQLRQAQKMEAVGHLAAGVAHDFNNILTVIQGHASLQISKKKLEAGIEDSFRAIGDASARAAELTRQLLAFSRKQVMQPRVVRFDHVLESIGAMLRRLLGEEIDLVISHPENPPRLRADVCNMEQVILNLALNARDAMPGGGTLTVSSSSVHFADEKEAAHPDGRAGRFAVLTVSDTGTGMDSATAARIFEPFFTTKEFGKGTGMGMATVYGIVKQHDGWIALTSAPGAGTTFQIYLPATEEAETLADVTSAPRPVEGTGSTVLLVEDDPTVRELAMDVLTHHGFTVIEACDGHRALEIWAREGDRIDLLLTDMAMPGGLSGMDVAERIRASHPKLKVIFSSGYSAELFGEQFEDSHYLPKPYLAATLAETVQRALDDALPAVVA